MPYTYDPYTFSYVYHEEGKAPVFDRSGPEYIPGSTQAYVDMFPNQPYSQIDPSGSGKVSILGASTGSSSVPTADGIDPDVAARAAQASSASSASSTKDAAGNTRDAYEYLSRLFDSYGLSSLAPKILEYVQAGYGPDTISLMLQDSPEYKQRFAGNEARKQAGLAVLSPAEYLSVERSYRQILESNGMPKGFYDDQSDFTAWIGSDVAPQEIQERVTLAVSAVNNTDSAYLQSLREYGLGEGDLVAAMLDRERVLPLLQKTVREAEIGAEARRQGLAISKARAGYFDSLGVDRQAAAGAYQTIGANLGHLEQLGDIYGDDSYGQADIEDELLGRSGAASERRRRLQSREVGSFSGQSAVGRSSLAGQSRGEF